MEVKKRIYRSRKATITYFCALCRAERFSKVVPRLSALNFLQIILLTGIFTALSFPLAQWSGLVSFFVFWATLEGVKRHWFKRDLSCPHCGFNALKYRKDVGACREEVKAFWSEKNSSLLQK
jgi:DNA-directed RNA polymerase subunit RPC12/RpoP